MYANYACLLITVLCVLCGRCAQKLRVPAGRAGTARCPSCRFAVDDLWFNVYGIRLTVES
jgi:hypothetical protein